MTTIEGVPERRVIPDRRQERQRELEEQLRAALDHDELRILFQPLFSADGALIGAEALSRWTQPSGEELASGAMFGFAADRAIARALSGHVAGRALAEAADWPEHLRLSLNITAADLSAGNFADVLAPMAAASGVPFDRITVEVTEQALVTDLAFSAARLMTLAELGARIAIDDFGAGFCNFRYLKHLPLHYLKMDRSLVEGIGEDRRDLEILRGIMAMASALGLEVIAEGVETERQRAAVVREGCVAWQGFLGSPPMTGAEFRAFAREFAVC